jgi:hypothetical protein
VLRRTEVVAHLYKATIESVALFQNLEKDVIISICIALDHTVVLKKDFIMVSTSTVVAARGCPGGMQHLDCVDNLEMYMYVCDTWLHVRVSGEGGGGNWQRDVHH